MVKYSKYFLNVYIGCVYPLQIINNIGRQIDTRTLYTHRCMKAKEKKLARKCIRQYILWKNKKSPNSNHKYINAYYIHKSNLERIAQVLERGISQSPNKVPLFNASSSPGFWKLICCFPPGCQCINGPNGYVTLACTCSYPETTFEALWTALQDAATLTFWKVLHSLGMREKPTSHPNYSSNHFST